MDGGFIVKHVVLAGWLALLCLSPPSNARVRHSCLNNRRGQMELEGLLEDVVRNGSMLFPNGIDPLTLWKIEDSRVRPSSSTDIGHAKPAHSALYNLVGRRLSRKKRTAPVCGPFQGLCSSTGLCTTCFEEDYNADRIPRRLYRASCHNCSTCIQNNGRCKEITFDIPIISTRGCTGVDGVHSCSTSFQAWPVGCECKLS